MCSVSRALRVPMDTSKSGLDDDVEEVVDVV